MVWRITPSNLLVDDPDAIAYLVAVEAADGQALESGVRLAVNAFVKGCKADGIWPAIKASCILAGARTLSGALVPLVGTAPTNSNFVSADYNRKTGLTGNASTKTLNINRANNVDPQNSRHVGLYVSTHATGGFNAYFGGSANAGDTQWGTNISYRINSSSGQIAISTASTGFCGLSRQDSAGSVYRMNGTTTSSPSDASAAPQSTAMFLFSRNQANYANCQISFYSFGESLNLNLFDIRVTTLINALAAAIP